MKRREFLQRAGLAIGAVTLSGTGAAQAVPTSIGTAATNWDAFRDLFPLTRDYIQLATFLLASHPRPVAEAIETHRRAFDENPAEYWHRHYKTIDGKITDSAARYMGGTGSHIALTDSTTMSLAMVYSGLQLAPGTEILQTTHDHYSTDLSLQLRAKRTGASVRRISLYDDPARVSVDGVCSRLRDALQSETRVFACTWVHSSTGVKLPIKAMSTVIDEINSKRDKGDQILFCVDGVHGFGVENQDVSQLGCDFFMAGTHKWIFGPRGTGVIWGNERAWSLTRPVIPSFSESYSVWLGLTTPDQVPVGQHMTPGGFHSFESRWALPAAFDLHLAVGKARVQERIHALNTQTKQGLAELDHVKLYTPMSPELSSGLVCFDVDGIPQVEVVKRLRDKGIIASATPYRKSYARFAPSLLNAPAEIDTAVAEVKAMA
ncbi:aminotransferase class V-fold PLP-dependent enzyme [Microbulbifer spongiae]|uniref:Aminotransferase class V-fold PLP-dependent enzyme n=1 Tax=Microbulbifer spongiae TaxID=2944933 RepID=A0ABY9E9Y8_9GAMM|nr:aminotransferase class V-fold PLP-dependent enzyme [Microbulbifer sp. MI-G]WKD48903.1 aminotransferase class V-fold PLP-dependent enzyme [Microbulbifer sp. MI-G]